MKFLFVMAAAVIGWAGEVPAGRTDTSRQANNPESAAAVQALRLFGAVEITHFSRSQGYATPAELKKARLLDPQWPRVSPRHYRVACQVAAGRAGFVCFADPLQGGPWLRIDDSQKLRTESGKRPSANSPLLRFSMN